MPLNTAQGNLAIVDGDKVFWKGAAVAGVESVFLHSDESETRVKLFVANGDEPTLADMEAAGIKIRRV